MSAAFQDKLFSISIHLFPGHAHLTAEVSQHTCKSGTQVYELRGAGWCQPQAEGPSECSQHGHLSQPSSHATTKRMGTLRSYRANGRNSHKANHNLCRELLLHAQCHDCFYHHLKSHSSHPCRSR